MAYDCTAGPLSPAMTGLLPGEIPDITEVRCAPGPLFARDCTMIVLAPLGLTDGIPGGGQGADGPSLPRKANLPRVPVWQLLVCYVEKCLPAPRGGEKPALAGYNTATCAYVRRAAGIRLGIIRGRATASCLFTPGFLGSCYPPADLYPDVIDVETLCAGLDVGPMTFKGPNGDVASAEFTVSFQWAGA